jgi:Cdc6-like AAA superfamily ATPase
MLPYTRIEAMDDTAGRPLTEAPNPFSPTAVARVSDLDPGAVTVPTLAIRQAIGYLDRYLSSRSTRPNGGGPGDAANAIAIVGDYGTGKTHLVVELLSQANRVAGGAVRTVYLDAPADTFVALHRRLIDHLHRDEIRDRVRHYFAETAGPERPAIDGPRSPAAALSEAEQRFARRLRQDLASITVNPAFGTALTLLLRPEYETAVWEWLMGYPPDRALVEHGVTAGADAETTAVEAMGVFALLYCRQDQRFVLVVDELDKILSAASRSSEEAVARFDRMRAVFASAGAFLVLAGLPDFVHVLGDDVRQRIGPIVKMSALTGEEVEQFISQSQLRAFGEDRLAPFTRDTVNYLTQLADGVVRRIIRLCYHVYQHAVQARSPVTHAMVRDVVRTHFDLVSKQDVRAEVRRVLNAESRTYQRDHLFGSLHNLPVDFWVPLPHSDSDAGCCVLLTESVLKSEEVDDLNRRALSIRAAIPDSETILVVVGYLPTEFAAELTEAFGVEPIVYDSRSFGEDISTAIRAVLGRLDQATGVNSLASVRQRVEQIQRQQADTQRFMDQLVAQLDEMRASSEAGISTIQRQLAGAAAAAPGGAGWREPGSSRPSGLPAPVYRLFAEALQVLDDLTGFEATLVDAFAAPAEGGRHTVEHRAAIRSLLRSRDVLRAVGTSVLLRRLIEAFRDGVNDWYATRAVNPAASGEAQLDELCDTYQAIAEYLPLFQLDLLTDLATSQGTRADLAERAATRSRLADARGVFDGLGARVRRMVLEAAA